MARTKKPIEIPNPLTLDHFKEACEHARRLQGVEAMIAQAKMAGVDVSATENGLRWSLDRIRGICNVYFPDQQNPVQERETENGG